MASTSGFWMLPYFAKIWETKPLFRVRVHGSGNGDSTVVSSDSFVENRSSFVREEVKNEALVDGGKREGVKYDFVNNGRNGVSKSRAERKWIKDVASNNLGVLWDDGYGTKTVKDYLDEANVMVKLDDGGPPRWFCPVESCEPLKGSPVLLFLPGIDGVGLGIILHHKALGKVFEVRCLHIPLSDRTSFLGLINLVEETIRHENAASPNKPIYLVGDSFGGCLALAVAARNPKIDLVLVLANPATSFGSSQLQPILPILKVLPGELHFTLPYLLSFVLGNPLKLAAADIEYRLPPRLQMEQMSRNLVDLLPRLSVFADILPKDTFLWKLELLKSAADYANSRLHAVKAEVLLLASGSDSLLPSGDEAQRLKRSLQNCTVRYFRHNGHTLLMEDGISLLTVIKGTCKYRRSSRLDYVADFIPPSVSEFKQAFDEVVGLVRFASGSAIFSTLDNGKIVKGLAGVPEQGPVLLVGYHMLMGIDTFSLVEQFLKEKNIMVRGVAHPILFSEMYELPLIEFSVADWVSVMGGVPVTASNLFKLLSNKSHVLLYPGGQREALHYKGEEYKLFWPDQPEFVRMAARFGATIVPFGGVGEDDIVEYVFDYHDLMKVPVVNDFIRDLNKTSEKLRIRDESQGEVGNPNLSAPIMVPKVPGRFYFLFGKPIRTEGMKEMLENRDHAKQLYLQIKSEVEQNLAYLLKKREEDPYRNLIDRSVYRATYGPLNEVPTFDP